MLLNRTKHSCEIIALQGFCLDRKDSIHFFATSTSHLQPCYPIQSNYSLAMQSNPALCGLFGCRRKGGCDWFLLFLKPKRSYLLGCSAHRQKKPLQTVKSPLNWIVFPLFFFLGFVSFARLVGADSGLIDRGMGDLRIDPLFMTVKISHTSSWNLFTGEVRAAASYTTKSVETSLGRLFHNTAGFVGVPGSVW